MHFLNQISREEAKQTLTAETWNTPAREEVADFPAVLFHICNFDICHENIYKYKYQRMKIRVSWVGQSTKEEANQNME